jgi:sugar phosphate isomerase/epimerase
VLLLPGIRRRRPSGVCIREPCRSKAAGQLRFRATVAEILQPANSKLSQRAVSHEILRNESIPFRQKRPSTRRGRCMRRRTFLTHTGGLMLAVSAELSSAPAGRSASGRVGMGTVIFRNRFELTNPDHVADDRLSLLDVPAYYRRRFDIRSLEFWSKHFTSLETPYLEELRNRIETAGSELINIQVDEPYDLASTNEEERQRSLALTRKWIDAAALLRSRAVRINPGRTGGSIDKSIASMKELNQHCISKRLPLLTENHFGLEMDPDVHLRIREAAGPTNIYTLPDFGNYPVETMWDSLAKILPYAYVVSAKAVDFDAQGSHISYDFDRCVQLCESAGFKGIYLVEQWSRKEQDLDSERIADWLLKRVRENIR